MKFRSKQQAAATVRRVRRKSWQSKSRSLAIICSRAAGNFLREREKSLWAKLARCWWWCWLVCELDSSCWRQPLALEPSSARLLSSFSRSRIMSQLSSGSPNLSAGQLFRRFSNESERESLSRKTSAQKSLGELWPPPNIVPANPCRRQQRRRRPGARVARCLERQSQRRVALAVVVAPPKACALV